jgi:hypothetical protein
MRRRIVIVRIGLVVAVLASLIVAGMPWNGATSSFQPATAQAAPAAGPAATTVSGLTFSRSMDSDGRAGGVDVEFGGGNRNIWVSFDYRDHDGNAKVSYLVRANGEDYKWGRINCCPNNSGHAAFEITHRNGGDRDLPGAAYEVRLYVNDAEVAVGGFGIKGRSGLDQDNQGDGGGNDNN